MVGRHTLPYFSATTLFSHYASWLPQLAMSRERYAATLISAAGYAVAGYYCYATPTDMLLLAIQLRDIG